MLFTAEASWAAKKTEPAKAASPAKDEMTVDKVRGTRVGAVRLGGEAWALAWGMLLTGCAGGAHASRTQASGAKHFTRWRLGCAGDGYAVEPGRAHPDQPGLLRLCGRRCRYRPQGEAAAAIVRVCLMRQQRVRMNYESQ